MELRHGLIVYFVVIILVGIILLKLRIQTFSALVLALIVGQILINCLHPPSAINPWNESDSAEATYFLIQLLTPLIVFFFAVKMAWLDRKPLVE
jgi:hypothetical protein